MAARQRLQVSEHKACRLVGCRAVIDAWRSDYNHARPHAALGNRTPEEFKQTLENLENYNRKVA